MPLNDLQTSENVPSKQKPDLCIFKGPDSDDEMDSPDVEFSYSDSDTLGAELAEFYSYTENPEFPSVQK